MGQFDTTEDLSKNLPLPLAGTVAAALSQEGAQRFLIVFDAYRAVLQYVSATTVAAYASTHGKSATINQQLEALLKPSLGHWLDLNTAILREVGPNWSPSGPVGAELPGAWLREHLGRPAVHASHQLLELMRTKYAQPMDGELPRKITLRALFGILVNFRNLSGLGHGATIRERDAAALGDALEAALPEVIRTLEALFQYPLSYVEEKSAGVSGQRVKFYDLGIAPFLRHSPLLDALPAVPGHLYLRLPGAAFEATVDLHPLMVFCLCPNCDREQVFFLVHERDKGVRYVSFACGHHCVPASELDDLRAMLRRAGASLPAEHREPDAAEEILARLSAQRAREESRSARRDILLPYYALPERNPHFKGREREIAEIIGRVQRGDQLSLRSSVQGMGGVGKTTLAVEIAWRLLEQSADESLFPDGILWHRVREEPVEIALQRMAAALRSQTRIAGLSGDLLLEVFRNEVLGGRRMLVILDNADRIEPLRELLPALQGLPLLITSRREVAGFSAVNIGRIDPDAAAQLFVAHSGGESAIDETERGVIDEICGECGHLPLAVQLAACHLRETGLTTASLLRKLRQRKLDFLRAEETLDREAKDRDIRTSFALSVETLADEDRRTLSLCGLFEGRPFSLPALAAVAGLDDQPELRAAMARLRRLSLIELLEVADGESLIQLHPLLSEYALELLPVDDREVRQIQRMKYYLTGFRQRAEIFDSPEREHVLRALRWAQDRADHETIVNLASNRWHDVLRLGYKADAIELLRWRVASAAVLDLPGSVYSAAFYLADQLWNSGLTDEGRLLLARCRRFFEWEGTRNSFLASCLRLQLRDAWDEPAIYSRFVEAALVAVRSRHRPPVGTRDLARLLECVGLGRESSTLQREALALKPHSRWSLWDDLRLAWGDEDTVNLDRYRTALETGRAKAAKDRQLSDLRMHILPGLVVVASRTGQTEGADTLLAEWKQLIERSRVPAAWVDYYQHRAHLEVARGHVGEAVRDLSRAVEIQKASGVQERDFDLNVAQALRDALAGDADAARRRLEDLREQAMRWSHGGDRLEWLAISAYTASRLGDDDIASEHLAAYRSLNRDLGRGEKPGGYEPLLRLLPAGVHRRANETLAGRRPSPSPTGFVFERDVPVTLPPRVRSRRDGRIMVLVPHGFAPVDGKREGWLVPAFYLDAEPVTVAEYASVLGHSLNDQPPRDSADEPVDAITFEEAREFAHRVGKELPEDFDLWRAAAAFAFPGGFAELSEEDLRTGIAAGPLPVRWKFAAAEFQTIATTKVVAELCDQIVSRFGGNLPGRILRAVVMSPSLPVEQRLALLRSSHPVDADRFQALEQLLKREASLLDVPDVPVGLWAVWWMRLRTLASRLGLDVTSTRDVTGVWTSSRSYLGPRSRRQLRTAFLPEPSWESGARSSRLGPVALPENERLCGLGIRCIRRIRCASDADDLEAIEGPSR
jgi:hypothetical protein